MNRPFLSTLVIENSPLSICQCCLSDLNLINVQQSFIYEGEIVTYSEIILECFSIELKHHKNIDQYVCETCILKLRESWLFQKQIKSIQLELMKCYISKESQFPTDIKREDTPECNGEISIKYNSPDSFLKENFGSPSNDFSNRESLIKEALMLNETQPKNKNLQGHLQSFTNSYYLNMDTEHKIVRSNKSCSDFFLPQLKVKKNKLMHARERYENAKPYKLDKSTLSCNICNETFVTHKSLIMHMSIHYPKFICDICGKSFTFKTKLKRHIFSHNDKVPCKICSRLLKQASMKRHIRIHLEVNPQFYICPHCPQRFASFADRSKHLAQVHNIVGNKYSCKVCPKIFLSSGSLSMHTRKVHLQEINHTCDECGRGFFKKIDLTKHRVVHTGEKKFHCEICDNYYGRKSTLSEHMKIHNNVRNYQCIVCNKTFTQKCTLKGHMKIHKFS